MDQCLADITEHVQEVITFSGRSAFFKGNYQECLDHHYLRYAMVELGVGGLDAGLSVGVCVPRSCDDGMVAEGLDEVLGWANSTMQVFALDSHIADYKVGLDWLSYLTIIILSALLLLAIYSTFNSKKNKKKHALLEAFDVNQNMSHFKIREREPLNIMDGVRAIAMMWVVFGHAYSFMLSVGAINLPTIQTVASKPFFLLVEAGLLSVDIFLLLSGFFLAFAFMREKATGAAAFGMGVLQRILRIWPSYILAMMFYYSLFMPIGGGMFWKKAENDVAMCQSMWREVFFVANMIDRGKEMCLGWGWYLQVDFQLFLFGLILLFLYRRSKLATILLVIVSMIASTIFNITYTYNHQIRIFTDLSAFVNFQDFMLDLYEKPWGRCTPYLIGLLLGIIYMEFRLAEKDKTHEGKAMSKLKRWFEDKRIRMGVEWLGIGLMAFVTFIPRCQQTGDCTWSQMTHSFYWGLSKPIFLIGMIMTILPSILGHSHSFFNLILTPKIFHFIARISFCTYLVHLMVLYYFILSRNYNMYYNITDVFVTYLGMLVQSLIFGFLATLFIELPFAKLQKHALTMLKAKAKASKEKARPVGEMAESLITEGQVK